MKDQPAPYDGIIITDEAVGRLLFDIQKLPILEEEKANLLDQVKNLKDTCGNVSEQVANLNQQIDKYKQLLEIEKARSQLEHERAQFYIDQGTAKDKIIDQQDTLNQRLIKEAEKKSLWKSLALGELFLFIGTAIGLVL